MIEVEINGKVKKIDTEISIQRFQVLNKKIDKLKEPGEMLAFYMDIPLKEMKKLPKNKVDFIEKYLVTEMTKPSSDEVVLTFTHDGIEYGLENDWSKLAWGAWQDFEILSAENVADNIHHIMAILYRPITEKKGTKYKIEQYDEEGVLERKELFKEIPVKLWFGASAFFFQIVGLYITDIKNTLTFRIKMNQLMMKGLKILPKFLRPSLRLDSTSNLPYPLRLKI